MINDNNNNNNNDNDNDNDNSVTLTATPDSVTGFIVKDVLIAPNSSLRVLNSGEKLIVASQNSLNVQANINDSLDCVLSYVEIS